MLMTNHCCTNKKMSTTVCLLVMCGARWLQQYPPQFSNVVCLCSLFDIHGPTVLIAITCIICLRNDPGFISLPSCNCFRNQNSRHYTLPNDGLGFLSFQNGNAHFDEMETHLDRQHKMATSE